MGAPGVSRSTREEQHLFVNRRPVENRGLNFALLEGYHTALMKGRYPVCCLFLEIEPTEVDVNIHPSKREVKFRRERDVQRFVAQAVRQTLLRFHTTPEKAEAAGAAMPGGAVAHPVETKAPVESELPLPSAMRPILTPPASRPMQRPLAMGFAPPPSRAEPAPVVRPSSGSAPVALVADLRGGAPEPATRTPTPLLSVPLRLVGVIGKLYVVFESDRGLVLMDQHAAHERVLFEQMLARMEHGNTASQRLLLPETVELPPRDAQFLRENLATLSRLGVGLSEFGERTFLLDALPPFVKVADARRFAVELVDELKATGQAVNAMRLGEHVVAKTVCRHAVKANDSLAGPELQNLLEDLRRCAMPYTCPHGRPTLIEMSYGELEKKFGRTQ